LADPLRRLVGCSLCLAAVNQRDPVPGLIEGRDTNVRTIHTTRLRGCLVGHESDLVRSQA
jgi:hypothetical protein